MDRQRNAVFHRFSLETKSVGLNPRITDKGKLYDKLVAIGSFFIDSLPVVGIDNARYTVKAPSGERKRVHSLDAAYKAIEAWAIEQAATVSTLKSTDSALVTWRIKNYASA